MSRTGRTSTSEPGRKARISPSSTVKPPLTLPVILPLTVSSASKSLSRNPQAWFRLAFSRDNRVATNPSSTASRATSTWSPTDTSNSPSEVRNWLFGMTPSDFNPALTMTFSGVISITVPMTMAPGRNWVLARLCSNRSAKLSVMGSGFLNCRALYRRVRPKVG